jgi:hypothetical protein
MRTWRLRALTALLAGLLGLVVAEMSNATAADDADANTSGQPQARSAPAAVPAPPQKSADADPARALAEPSDSLLVVGGGLLVLALAAIGLTITFRSLLEDRRNRRNRYRRRAKRETRST